MASQVVGTSLRVLEFDSYVRGYHAYKDMWNPALGDVLPLEREITNPKDKFAVALMKGSMVVGHIPYNIAPAVSHFLKRSINKATVEVTGAAVNRRAGYGMEIKSLANTDFMARMTTLRDSGLSCRRNSSSTVYSYSNYVSK